MVEHGPDTSSPAGSISFIDFLSVLCRKRRIWIGFTLAGVLAGLLFGLSGLFSSATKSKTAAHSFSLTALVPDDSAGPIGAALAKTVACADLVAKELGPERGKAFGNSVSAEYAPMTHFLKVTVTSPSREDSEAEANAAMNAISRLLTDYVVAKNRTIAKVLDARASELARAANGEGAALDEKDRIAAQAKAIRIEDEVYRDAVSGVSSRNDPASLALDALARTRAKIEAAAMLDAAGSPASPAGVGAVNPAIEREAARLLHSRAALYLSLEPASSDPLKIVDSDIRSTTEGGYRFPVRSSVLIVIAALFLGILAAFLANAWDKIREDPEAMAKLRSR